MRRSGKRGAACLLLLVFAWAAAGTGLAGEDDLPALLDGVHRIAAPGVPGPLCVFGEAAFPVVAGGVGKGLSAPVVAAARLGAGRIVAFGHTGYLDPEAMAAGDTGRLMANAIRWAAVKPAPAVAVLGQDGLLPALRKQGVEAVALSRGDWRRKLPEFQVLCANPNSLPAADDVDAAAAFVEKGGGLILADTGWGWLQLHPGKTLLADHPGNRLLARAGIVWTDGTLKRTDDLGFAAGAAPPPLTHAARAMDALVAHAEGKSPLGREEAAQAAWIVADAARSLPPADKLLLPRLRRLQADRAAEVVPTPQHPLGLDKPLERVLLTLQIEDAKRLPPEQVRAHPAAAAFPGAVPPEAPRVARSLEVETAIPGWHSTGLYAAPGEAVTVEVPQEAASLGLTVRIGCHSDGLWGLASWKRCPEVCRRFPVSGPSTRAANAFGGLIYIEVLGGRRAGTISVKVSGAVAVPYYVLAKTDLTEWRTQIRLRPAPWAELATSKVVVTLPSKAVRGLDDPESLMKLWDRVLDACADLAGRPLDRPRPERYVTDVQISAGYMHSGYPIMTLLDMPEVMVDKARLTSNGHGGVWGLYHELGHNHQSRDWTFDGTGEVTVNLFTLYVFDKVCGRPRGSFDRIGGEARARMLKAYFAAPDFAKWKRDPFLALILYAQLQEAFGWDAFKRVFAEYRDLPAAQRPKSDAEKRDQWLVRFSRAVGRDLGPFFQAWAVPTSEKARASVADLPPWMPDGFPPK